jgi:hypothetical protein
MGLIWTGCKKEFINEKAQEDVITKRNDNRNPVLAIEDKVGNVKFALPESVIKQTIENNLNDGTVINTISIIKDENLTGETTVFIEGVGESSGNSRIVVIHLSKEVNINQGGASFRASGYGLACVSRNCKECLHTTVGGVSSCTCNDSDGFCSIEKFAFTFSLSSNR